MNAIVPLNVTALRVNKNDAFYIVSKFKGRTALFEKLPYQDDSKLASTGDTIFQSLESDNTPANPFNPGVHIHWELPDYFRRGRQASPGSEPGADGQVEFPHTPNRWLVVRYLSQWNTGKADWEPAQLKTFLIESDYVNKARWDNSRAGVTVPLAVGPGENVQPFKYLGRVLEYSQWAPAGENPQDFLPYYKDTSGKQFYLTSIGFVGPGFASFYPECSSVFGFWDNFADVPAIYKAIDENAKIKFRVSYQVIGWVNEPQHDPLNGIASRVTTSYNDYVAEQKRLKLEVAQTPPDFFVSSVSAFAPSWTFNKKDIAYTLNGDDTIKTLTVPEGTLSAGIMQEVVWDMLDNPAQTYFLSNPDSKSGISGTWTDTVEVAIGNNTAEALSALLKKDLGQPGDGEDILKNYEYLLNALQLGLLRTLEDEPNKLILLDEALHTRAFAALSGGLLWSIEAVDTGEENVNLPVELAENLALLNFAQKTYDQARAAIVTMTGQLFLDWLRFVKMYVANSSEGYLTWQNIQTFLDARTGSELEAVKQAVQAAGLVSYLRDDNGRIIGIDAPPVGNTLAYALFAEFNALARALEPLKNLEALATTAPPFRMPAEPVVVVEGKRIEPVRRNGETSDVFVRLSSELFNSLTIQYAGTPFHIPTSSLKGVPVATPVTPMQDDVQALLAEAFLLVLSLAPVCADALRAQAGDNNPAVADYGKFLATLQLAQGGASPLEGPGGTGLFATVQSATVPVGPNPSEAVKLPMDIAVTFTNETNSGWAPDTISWITQSHPDGFPPERLDPFLPMFMLWRINLRPLSWGSVTPGQVNYTPDNLERYFEITSDAVDYEYLMPGGKPIDFTIPIPSSYSSFVVLSKRPVLSLTAQIDLYLKDFPNDPAKDTLIAIRDWYHGRRILSQTLNGVNIKQILANYIPQIAVENLPFGSQDGTTLNIQRAASGADSWYAWAFNSQQPIVRNQPGNTNFGPLRAGFLQITGLTIVDVFGQVMDLSTEKLNADKSLQTIVSYNMQPREGDTVNASWIYLPPRLLTPTRVWFRWLSALQDDEVAGLVCSLIETNSHAATSPICGWILPNHLNASLFFYKSDGEPIGSFGIEAGRAKYRTRPANHNNNRDDLALDIGPKGHPKAGVNPHLAEYMWWVDAKGKSDADFLRDLMKTILDSDTFINPANFAQDPALAVLIGRPLAITRTMLALETQGGTLPISQADVQAESPFPQDVLKKRVHYAERQAASSASLDSVKMPARLGDLANMDDGLVGYLIEETGDNPYGTFYSPAAPAAGGHGVVRPQPTTIELTLNADPIVLTLLVDPRAGIHLTTGVLPVEEINIPVAQYGEAVSSLAMTFFSNPVLRGVESLVLPLPAESGYDWKWIDPSSQSPTSLEPNKGTEFATFGYTPQTVQEGWLELVPAPKNEEE
jgi:hypothetical protein